jgi:hypothetical protein
MLSVGLLLPIRPPLHPFSHLVHSTTTACSVAFYIMSSKKEVMEWNVYQLYICIHMYDCNQNLNIVRVESLAQNSTDMSSLQQKECADI